jgi:hypothetical protein
VHPDNKNRVKQKIATFMTAKYNYIACIETAKRYLHWLLTQYIKEPCAEYEWVGILRAVLYVAILARSFGQSLNRLKVKQWRVKVLRVSRGAGIQSTYTALGFPLAPKRKPARSWAFLGIPRPRPIRQQKFPLMISAIPVLPTDAAIPAIRPVLLARVDELDDPPLAHVNACLV